MCIAPLVLADGTETACHECWQCRANRVRDWTGRGIAEIKTAKAAHVVTLTYGRSMSKDETWRGERVSEADHEHAVILTYSDVQKYLKLLRRHGFPVRYFCAGEYGSKNHRAHWHVVLFWQDRVPPHELRRNFMEEHWPHGWSFWTRADARGIRYVCKYLLKDGYDKAKQYHLAMSKKPPLGAAYFAELAGQYVASALAPQDLMYRFPVVRPSGAQEVEEFMLSDRSAELFLEQYISQWRARYGRKHWPPSDLVDAFHEFGVVTGWPEQTRAGRPVPRWQEKSSRPPRILWDEVDVEIQMEKQHGTGQTEVRPGPAEQGQGPGPAFYVEGRDEIGRTIIKPQGDNEAGRRARLRAESTGRGDNQAGSATPGADTR